MIVVADTSPLNYLIRLGYAELLQILYGRVLVPTAVMNELRHAGAPPVVRDWAQSPPSWLEEVEPHSLVPDLLASLGPGESEAISLALELHANFLIIDEIIGRREARNRRLQITGTLGILLESSIVGYVELPHALAELRRLGFRVSTSLEESLLAQYRAAKESQIQGTSE